MGLFKTNREEELFVQNTVIEHGMVVDASTLSGSCGLIIRGIVRSNIDIDADVVIDSTGSVDGEIVCSSCTVKGHVEGNISAAGRLVITSEGSVLGDIVCSSLEISGGGNFRGACNKIKKAAQEKKLNTYDIYVQKDPQIHLSDDDCHIGVSEGLTFRDACQKLSLTNDEFKDGFNIQSLTFYGRPLLETPEPERLHKTS